MKTYIQPAILVVEIENEGIIAQSSLNRQYSNASTSGVDVTYDETPRVSLWDAK